MVIDADPFRAPSRPPQDGGQNRDRGSVTVEAAVALSALTVIVAVCLAGIAAVIVQMRITDAAGVGARLAARGDDAGARAAITQLAPAGSTLAISGDDRVTVRLAAPPLGNLLPGVRLHAQAIAAREPPAVAP